MRYATFVVRNFHPRDNAHAGRTILKEHRQAMLFHVFTERLQRPLFL